MSKKYVVVYCGNDYDCGAPYAGISGNKAYDSYDEAFDGLLETFKEDAEVKHKTEFTEAIDNGDIEDGEWPSKHGHGKFGLGYYTTCDGTVVYDIEEINC